MSQTEFVRNPDGTFEVPNGVISAAAIFGLGGPDYIVSRLITLFGEAQALAMGAYAESLSKFSHAQLLGFLGEGWVSERPLAPIIELLQRLDPVFTLRAVLAQRLCSSYRAGFIHFASTPTVGQLLPFYATCAGLDGEAIRLHALRHADTVAG